MQKLTVYYRKNLKMTPGKLAAQVAHLALALDTPKNAPIIVLSATDAGFERLKNKAEFVLRDAGWTEVEPMTETCLGFFEDFTK